ncbi:MAG: T9SS type A sorting domain-containing protein, partial [Bacteroidota bacterium]
ETTVAVPGDFDVQPAYPNPFVQSTQFRISVDEVQRVRVDAYDVVGRRVARLFEGRVTASLPETIRWDNAALPAGTYLVRVQGESFSTQLRVVKAGS